MPTMPMSEIAAAVGGSILKGRQDHSFSGYHFDSRLLEENSLFFALKTESADGHNYLNQISNRPGCGAIVNHGFDAGDLDLPLIVVDDTSQAYERLAAQVRTACERTRFIGITGSAGKTTTRQFTRQLLGARFRCYEAPGNWNNWLGLSFALLNMPDDTEFGIFELAMSFPGIGEIERLARILRPNITCLLNALPTHLEFLKTIENVARGKLQINDHLGEDGIALINGDNDFLRQHSQKIRGTRVLFGHRAEVNDVVLESIDLHRDPSVFTIDFAGDRQVFLTRPFTTSQAENLFAALLIARHAGMSFDEIRAALPDLSIPKGRGRVYSCGGLTIVDDTYNSNPAALERLLSWADECLEGFTTVVIGDMLELGAEEQRYHREIGAYAASLNFNLIVLVGPLAREIQAGAIDAGFEPSQILHFDNAEDAGRGLLTMLPKNSNVVLKGSRGIGLDRTVKILTESF